jgi:thiamine biosynthesis protein ThiI
MKFVSLISSGIDSPVATYVISKIPDEIILLHGDIRPFTDDREIDNFFKIADHLKKVSSCKFKIYVLPHGINLGRYREECNVRYTCVYCKRMLLRYAEKIAEKEGADAIVMGDSLGQVASQTLQNINTIDSAVSLPIIRPLIGYDKEDIIRIAKDIGTYELSILPSDSCKAVPNKPATQAKLDKILDEEKKVDIKKLVNGVVDKSKIKSI